MSTHNVECARDDNGVPTAPLDGSGDTELVVVHGEPPWRGDDDESVVSENSLAEIHPFQQSAGMRV